MPRSLIIKDGIKTEQFPDGTVRTGAATVAEIAEYEAEAARVAYEKAAPERIAAYKAAVATAPNKDAQAIASKKWSEAVRAENRARVLARHRANQQASTKRLEPGVEDMASGNQRITKETKPS